MEAASLFDSGEKILKSQNHMNSIKKNFKTIHSYEQKFQQNWSKK